MSENRLIVSDTMRVFPRLINPIATAWPTGYRLELDWVCAY